MVDVKTGGVHNITEWQSESYEDGDFAFLGEVYKQGTDRWNELIVLNGENIVFKLDTRAAVTAIPSSSFPTGKCGVLQPPGKVLFRPGNQSLDVKGRFKG